MSKTTPIEFTATDPKYLDKKISDIQVKMKELSWITKSFERAYRLVRNNVAGEKVYYPAVYQGDGLDYWDCFPNDNENFSFVYVKQPVDFIGYRGSSYRFTAEVSIIVFFDLTAVGTDPDYRFTELLKEDCLDKLTTIGKLTVTQVYDEIEACYSDFSFAEIETEFMQDKFGALRFDCDIETVQYCKTNNTYT